MKKIGLYIGILLVLAGVFAPALSRVHAATAYEDCMAAQKAGGKDDNAAYAECRDKENGGAETAPPAGSDTSGFSWLNPIKWLTTAFVMIGYLIMQIGNLILILSGLILNWVLNMTVVNMAANINQMQGIQTAWKVIRDLMNIVFIFLLVYEGIKIIIGQTDIGKVQKFILSIVMASLLINFSMFFTKLIIDASNIVTIGFYNSIVGADSITPDSTKGLSNAFMGALHIGTIFAKDATVGNDTNMMIVELGAAVMAVVAAFAFFAISVMYVMRYLIFIVLLMTSPLAFMGEAVSFVGTYSKKWWDVLWGQVLFAPVHMIFTWVILTLINSPGFFIKTTDSNATLGQVMLAQNTGAIGLLINFALVIALIIMSLSIAKSTASKGVGEIGKWTGKATAFAGGAVFGGTAALGRNTIGRGGDWLANNEKLKEKAANGSAFAKLALKTGDKTAKSSFDFRSTKAGTAINKNVGVDLGKGADRKKVNFQENIKNKAKAQADFVKTLKPTEDAQEKRKDEEAKKAGYAGGYGEMGEIVKDQEAANKKRDDSKKKIDDLTKKEEDLTNKIKTEVNSDKRDRMKKEADAMLKEIAEENKNFADLQKIAKEKEAANKGLKDLQTKIDNKVKGVYEARVNQYADSFTKESSMSLWTKNILKSLPGAAIGAAVAGPLGGAAGAVASAAFMRSKADKREIARAIKKAGKEKSGKEKVADAFKDWAKEDDTILPKEETPPAATPTTPAAAPEPPPTS
jgi:hypothetical protein